MRSVSGMAALSQIVGGNASPYCHTPCVLSKRDPWHIVGVPDSDDKNGGPNFLRAWRVKRGKTQQQLAEAVKTNANMIQYLESGERGLSAKWLRRLAPALQTTPGMLLDTNPEEVDFELHDLWTVKLDREDRRKLRAITEAFVKTGTDAS